MVSFTYSLGLIVTLAIAVSAQGTQFITGECSADADCASGCCGFNSGLCAGPAVAQERDGGCGFGDATPNSAALDNLQKRLAQGTQFITGECTADSDCASGCCGFNSGLCAGAVVAQERDGGCGFGNSESNSDAADALQARKQKVKARSVKFSAA